MVESISSSQFRDLPTLAGEENEYQRRLSKIKRLNGKTRERILQEINAVWQKKYASD